MKMKKTPEEIGIEWLDKVNEPAIISIVDRPKEDEFCVPRSMIKKAIKLSLKAEREEVKRKIELLKGKIKKYKCVRCDIPIFSFIDKAFKGEK